MIKLIKYPKPRVLIENEDKWKNEYMASINSAADNINIPRHYSHNDIKEALIVETHGKCAYCESKFRHVTSGDIEHILPKNKNARPDLVVEWTNLTLSCPTCNRQNKKDYYDPQLPLINPYVDEPEQYLQEIGEYIFPASCNKRGDTTIIVIDLNRADLLERRRDKLFHTEVLLEKWFELPNGFKRSLVEEQLLDLCKNDKEYASTVRAFLKARGFSPLLSTQ